MAKFLSYHPGPPFRFRRLFPAADEEWDPVDFTALSSTETCGSGLTCTEAGSTCSVGDETCCGETYPSMQCECDGSQYFCFYTDACMMPTCCIGAIRANKIRSNESCSGAGAGDPCAGQAGFCCFDEAGSFCWTGKNNVDHASLLSAKQIEAAN